MHLVRIYDIRGARGARKVAGEEPAMTQRRAPLYLWFEILAMAVFLSAAGGSAAGTPAIGNPANGAPATHDPGAAPNDGLSAQDAALPEALRGIGIDQRLGQRIPLDLAFHDETGREVRLREYFADKPVILTLNYYECPMLCTLVLNGLVSSMRTLNFSAGKEFTIVTVSINPRETPSLAASKKTSYLHDYGRPGAGEGWHFLTGEEKAIARLAEAVGFHYRYDPVSHQYAHAAGIMILTPDGRLARYFYGVEFAPRNLRLGLVEASEGKIGSLADQLLLFCFHYDPATGKYGTATLNVMRAGGVLTILVLGGLIFAMLRRESRRLAAGSAA